jgi:putative ABC transport system permease protein
VADVRPTSLDSEPRAELYVPYAQSGTGSVTFVIEANGDAAALVPKLQAEVWAEDPKQAIDHAATLEQLVGDTLVERRFNLILLGALSIVALILATVGVYGLISFATQQRSGEIGVRIALGARRGEVTGMLVREALRLAVPGILLGLFGALALTRFLSSMLYQVHPSDPVTFFQLSILMLVIAATAAWVPARHAAGTDPMHVLRQE